MKPIIYPNCKIIYFDRVTFEWGILSPEEVEVTVRDGITYYNLIKPSNRKLLIVQALNEKKASAKMLTLIHLEQKELKK